MGKIINSFAFVNSEVSHGAKFQFSWINQLQCENKNCKNVGHNDEGAEIKTTKISSEGLGGKSAKFCISENFLL